MTKKVAVIGSGKATTRSRIPKDAGVIEVLPTLPLFKELSIGQKFKWKNSQYKKVSSFAGYRNKVGLYSFGANTPVEINKNIQP